jgi:tetratricopeptide (TPR) repeat protein
MIVKHAPRLLSAVLALTLLMVGRAAAQGAAPAPSGASAHADTLFNEGKAKLASEDYAEACRLFAGSFAIDPATGTLLALALCHERAGDLKAAIAEYRSAAKRAQLEGRADRAEAATKRADELEAKLRPEPAPAPVATAPRPRPQPIRPLEPAYEQPASTGLSAGQWAGIATASAGVLAFAASAGFALHASSLNDDSKAGCDGDLCTAEARELRLDAVSAGNLASAMALGGAVLACTGAVLFFSSGSERPSEYALAPWITPNAAGATARGRF